MKRLFLICIFAFALTGSIEAKPQSTTTQQQAANAIQSANLALGQTQPSITANRIVTEGSVIHFVGKVVIQTDKTVIEADEADFHSDISEIEVRGHIVKRPISALGQSTYIETAEKMLLRVDRIMIQPPQSKP